MYCRKVLGDLPELRGATTGGGSLASLGHLLLSDETIQDHFDRHGAAADPISHLSHGEGLAESEDARLKLLLLHWRTTRPRRGACLGALAALGLSVQPGLGENISGHAKLSERRGRHALFRRPGPGVPH